MKNVRHTREVYELFQKGYYNGLPDLGKKAVYYIVTNQKYIDTYRFNCEYHPYHAFSMSNCGHIEEMNCSAIYIVGAQAPGYASAMGVTTRSTFEEALQDAKRYVGDQPNILALPKSFKLSAVH